MRLNLQEDGSIVRALAFRSCLSAEHFSRRGADAATARPIFISAQVLNADSPYSAAFSTLNRLVSDSRDGLMLQGLAGSLYIGLWSNIPKTI
jgi:hypothetical protein